MPLALSNQTQRATDWRAQIISFALNFLSANRRRHSRRGFAALSIRGFIFERGGVEAHFFVGGTNDDLFFSRSMMMGRKGEGGAEVSGNQ